MCCKDGEQECSWACAASFPKKVLAIAKGKEHLKAH
jgi:hypothetical protein